MKSTILLTAGLFLGAALHAQTAPCFSLNASNNNATRVFSAKSSAGPNSWALRWTPSQVLVAQAMTIYTHSRYRDNFHSLEIWSDDSAKKVPLARIGGGTWVMPKGTPSGWYGTNFDRPIVLNKGRTYWLVWVEGGWSGIPSDFSSIKTLPLMRRVGNGAWQASSQAWGFKFRLFCSLLDQKTVSPIGKSCSGSTKAKPTTFTTQPPSIGNTRFRIEGTGVPSGAVSFLILGGKKNFQPVSLGTAAPGCWLNTDLVLLLLGKSGTGNQQANLRVGAANHVFFPLPVPADRNLVGAYLGVQIAVHDVKSKNPLPIVFTNGLRITLF